MAPSLLFMKKHEQIKLTKGGISITLLKNKIKPINGMIKTYSDSNRTFLRPYSAKTVFFYKDGDEYFTVKFFNFFFIKINFF